MPKTSKPLDAEQIAEMADRGEDISSHFTNSFTVVRRVNVDFTAPMLRELDQEATMLNVSRQAVIKTLLRDALDRRHLAAKARQGS